MRSSQTWMNAQLTLRCSTRSRPGPRRYFFSRRDCPRHVLLSKMWRRTHKQKYAGRWSGANTPSCPQYDYATARTASLVDHQYPVDFKGCAAEVCSEMHPVPHLLKPHFYLLYRPYRSRLTTAERTSLDQQIFGPTNAFWKWYFYWHIACGIYPIFSLGQP